MTQRHKVFVSYHHANDQAYKDQFDRIFAVNYGIIVSRSVGMGDIDPQDLKTETVQQRIRDQYLSDATVTVVLIGTQTWQRKHVDWEISASLRDTPHNPRSGLLGILLPTYPLYSQNRYDGWTIPPRLYDNLTDKPAPYATIHLWNTDPTVVQRWIHEAFLRKDRVLPNNARTLFAQNRAGDRWTN